MPVSLKRKLAGKEAEVLKAWKDFGTGGAMELYGIKTRPIFLQWIRDNTNGEWEPGPLAGFSRGKHKWMGEHRETIIDCVEIFGIDWVKDKFCFNGHDTLDRFIRFNGKPYTEKFTRLERLELDNRDLRARVAKLEKQVELSNTRFEISQEATRASRRDFGQHMNQHDDTVKDISQQLAQVITIMTAQGLRDYMPLLQRKDLLDITSLVAPPKPLLQEQANTLEDDTEPVADTIIEIIQPASSIVAPPKELKEAYMAAHPLAIT